jgi:hypothetical protein
VELLVSCFSAAAGNFVFSSMRAATSVFTPCAMFYSQLVVTSRLNTLYRNLTLNLQYLSRKYTTVEVYAKPLHQSRFAP